MTDSSRKDKGGAVTAKGSLLAALVFAGAAGAQQSDSHVFCRMTAGSERAALDACVARQIEAATAVARRLDAVRARPLAGGAVLEAFDACRGLWAPDWSEIERCLSARLEGRPG